MASNSKKAAQEAAKQPLQTEYLGKSDTFYLPLSATYAMFVLLIAASLVKAEFTQVQYILGFILSGIPSLIFLKVYAFPNQMGFTKRQKQVTEARRFFLLTSPVLVWTGFFIYFRRPWPEYPAWLVAAHVLAAAYFFFEKANWDREERKKKPLGDL